MQKLIRILALAGVGLLVILYGSTLFFAVSGNPNSEGWFKASIACTILVPVFLYANMLVYRYLKNKSGDLTDHKREEAPDADEKSEHQKNGPKNGPKNGQKNGPQKNGPQKNGPQKNGPQKNEPQKNGGKHA